MKTNSASITVELPIEDCTDYAAVRTEAVGRAMLLASRFVNNQGRMEIECNTSTFMRMGITNPQSELSPQGGWFVSCTIDARPRPGLLRRLWETIASVWN